MLFVIDCIIEPCLIKAATHYGEHWTSTVKFTKFVKLLAPPLPRFFVGPIVLCIMHTLTLGNHFSVGLAIGIVLGVGIPVVVVLIVVIVVCVRRKRFVVDNLSLSCTLSFTSTQRSYSFKLFHENICQFRINSAS